MYLTAVNSIRPFYVAFYYICPTTTAVFLKAPLDRRTPAAPYRTILHHTQSFNSVRLLRGSREADGPAVSETNEGLSSFVLMKAARRAHVSTCFDSTGWVLTSVSHLSDPAQLCRFLRDSCIRRCTLLPAACLLLFS